MSRVQLARNAHTKRLSGQAGKRASGRGHTHLKPHATEHRSPRRAPPSRPASAAVPKHKYCTACSTRHDSCRVTCIESASAPCTAAAAAGVVGALTQLHAVKANENRSAWTRYRDQHDARRNMKYLASHSSHRSRTLRHAADDCPVTVAAAAAAVAAVAAVAAFI